MASARLRSPDQAAPVRFVLGLYEALASLRLAVFVIGACAVVLGWATFVESRYGSQVVHFGIYGTRWFAALLVVLGLNVFCAASIRFPWKKHQTGFVITHTGILLLLVGCLLSRTGGIDAQLPVFEGGTAHSAFQDTQHFQLDIHRQSSSRQTVGRDSLGAGGDSVGAGRSPADQQRSGVESVQIPFASGPFNWADYKKLFWFPWRLSHRDQGIIYDQDGIRLEVLDYCSDSRLVAGSPIRLRVSSRWWADASGQKAATEGRWTTVELHVRGVENPHSPRRQLGLGGRQTLPGGQRIVFWVADSKAETEAFLNSRPENPLGELGQLVFHAGGKTFRFPVEQFEQQSPLPLGKTGAEVELVQLDTKFLGAVLDIHHPGEHPRRMVLLADFPEFNRHDQEHGVFGTYWFDASKRVDEQAESNEQQSIHNPHRPRIDIIQGADQKLYYRTWKSPQLGVIAPLPLGKEKVVAFENTEAPVTFYVQHFIPHDRPGWKIEPVPFAGKGSNAFKQRRALLRLSVDGNSEEFWLDGMPADPLNALPQQGQRRVVQGNGRRVAVTLPWDKIDLHFQLYLHEFQRKLDPGSSMASHYSSLVELRDRHEVGKTLPQKVLITLNEPANLSDPGTGRSYRVYQEAFRGPFRPGDAVFEQVISQSGSQQGMQPRDEVFLSWLTVNYDPGRGLKYFGSLMIVAGIATMFYMRAYFFKPQGTARQHQPQRGRDTGPGHTSDSVRCGTESVPRG